MNSASLSEQLATWLIKQRRHGFSDELLQVVQNYVLDWLGSALAGGATTPGKVLCSYASEELPGPCQIVGKGLRSSAEGSALANGGLSHIVEMDDLDRGSVLHPGAVVIPAALAMAEQQGATGRDFLNAVVAGYEVAIRIGGAVGKGHYYYFHNTATCGIFGAAAAAGWLLRLTERQMVWALGNAGTQSAGLWQFNREGAMSKHLHAGMAAAGGVRAAALAARDFTGSGTILEGEQGFFAAMAPDGRPELVVNNLGESPYKIQSVSIKPYASCRHTHPAVDSALAVHPYLDQSQIETCRIETYQAAIDLCHNPDPHTPYAAKFSLQYCVSSALIHGRLGLIDFTTEAIDATGVRELMMITTIALDAEFERQYPGQWAARLSVTLDDGSSICEQVLHPKGDPENALTPAELEVKFRQLAGFAGQRSNVDGWLTWINGLVSDQQLTVPDYRLD